MENNYCENCEVENVGFWITLAFVAGLFIGIFGGYMTGVSYSKEFLRYLSK